MEVAQIFIKQHRGQKKGARQIKKGNARFLESHSDDRSCNGSGPKSMEVFIMLFYKKQKGDERNSDPFSFLQNSMSIKKSLCLRNITGGILLAVECQAPGLFCSGLLLFNDQWCVIFECAKKRTKPGR